MAVNLAAARQVSAYHGEIEWLPPQVVLFHLIALPKLTSRVYKHPLHDGDAHTARLDHTSANIIRKWCSVCKCIKRVVKLKLFAARHLVICT